MLNKFQISFVKPNRCVCKVNPEAQQPAAGEKPEAKELSPKALAAYGEEREAALKNLPVEDPKQKAQEMAAAGKALDKAYQRSEILYKAKEKLDKNKSDVSLLELKTLAATSGGRNAMRTKFTSGEVSEGKSLEVDFGNDSAEWNIGAGDMLPANVREITVKTKDGEILQGKRSPNPENPSPERVGYYTASREYIPVFSGDRITVNKVATPEEMQAIEKKMAEIFANDEKYKGKNLSAIEDMMQEEALSATEENMKEALDALKNSGIESLENLGELKNLDPAKVEKTFTQLSGDQVWQIRKAVGPEGLKQIFAAAGLNGKKVNLKEIVTSNPQIQALKAKLPSAMVESVMKVESSGNQFDVSPTGALGCMQLTKWIYHDVDPPINPFDPKAAVQRAAEHLADLTSKHGEQGAVRAYNQGEGKMGNAEAAKYLAAYEAAKNKIG